MSLTAQSMLPPVSSLNCGRNATSDQRVDSLLAATREGCYICLILLKFLSNKYGLTELQSLKYKESFTTYEHHGKIDAESRHPFHFDISVHYETGYGVWFKAIPARGLTYSPELQGLPLNTGSERSWKQSFEWIEGCIKFHGKCNTVAESPLWYPRRLIDLGLGASAHLRLIDTGASPPLGRYVTLSYCWGSAATLKLTSETLGAFLTRLPEPELPKTFRDTIEVTTRLGIRYLWIDSLCIVQDSAEDWRAESSMMGRVYKNALCNIAASASADCQGGLFFDRDPRMVRPAVIVSQWSDCPPSTYQISKLHVWEDGVSDAVLNTRGWVLQERFLAPRIIHFASDQIYWECFELQACEAFPRGLPSTVRRHGLTLPMKELCFSNGGKELRPFWQQPPLPMFDGYRVWKQVVETYTCTHLTKSKDKLVAISALAKEARQALKDDYLAGLWRRHLGWELGWQVSEGDGHTRPSDYRCPSWSWASVEGKVYATDYGSDAHLFLKVLEAQITPLGDDDTGEVAGGFVRLQGPMYAVLLIPKDTMGQPNDRYDVYLSDRTTGREILRKMRVATFLDVDMADTTNSTEKNYCLLQYSSDIDIWCQNGNDEEDYYLMTLLLKYDGVNKNYRRQGLLQLMSFERGQSYHVGSSPSTRSQREGKRIIEHQSLNSENTVLIITVVYSVAKGQHQAYRNGVQDHDRDSDGVNPSIRRQPDGGLIRRLRDLECCHYNPDIPCEAYNDELGYMITIV
ncbi:heterokaryon incompatibility protein [Fusarium pseudoanthophilum]|uniref:Heterokaryon incompatibility protein n=1 Tax=Fusarium pseudoanthophilum TaxID=48495 RepID=A0A8H5NPP2_9HYPO|nr:heterokaryon incompatibility protein [Fusarium pseudoanthophilum]